MTYSMELDLSNVSQTFGKVDYSTGYHSVEIKSSKERIFQVLHEMTPADVRLMRPLFIIRALPALLIGKNPFPKEKLPILKGMEKQGFRVIADQSDKLVFGVIGKFWKLSGPETDIPKKWRPMHPIPLWEWQRPSDTSAVNREIPMEVSD